MNILEEIAAKTRVRVAENQQKITLAQMKEQAQALNADTGFPMEQALKAEGISFICEVKKASPSKGLIAEDFPYREIAADYEEGGAAAISVLTEPYYFQGSNEYLKAVRQTVSIPILRKDFTVDEYMIYEAKVIGADAVLLICAILSDEELLHFREVADSLGLTSIVEAHDEEEVHRAIKAGARVIGVNNRDLRNFTVDIHNSVRLRTQVPKDIIFISESGIKTAQDIKELERNAVDGVLIGETLMRAKDRVQALQQLKIHLKICGLRRAEDVTYANEVQPDFAGFVFAPSKRQVTREEAAELVEQLDPRIHTVGVFVDQPVDFIAELLAAGVIEYAQLHGSEDAVSIEALRKRTALLGKTAKIIKAVKVGSAADLENVSEIDCEYLLLDAWHKEGEAAGGNGRTFDWSLIKALEKPFFLAGGLTVDNVQRAVRMTSPYGIDASSCMETEGCKDLNKMKAFAQAVRGTETHD